MAHLPLSRAFRAALAAALIGLAASAAGQAPPAVDDRSSVAPDGTRTIELRIVVPAPPPAVWAAVSTVEGFRSWAVPFATGAFRLGEVVESSYDPDAKPGDRENIRNQVVAMVPGRMLAMRNVQAPTKVPFDVAAFQSLHTVLFLEPAGADATLVTLVTPGIGPGAAFDSVHKHFAWGNAYALEQLRRRFVDGPTDWAKLAAERKAKAGR
ncbi:MAG: hypothetical protein BroJett026_28150 [Betaproteobacteria bacterium]|nr:MAG: hypothetical protein BroJett026_28150 [Betaproteobacteria bacterium]